MAVQTGLGEPRGPGFISPQLDLDGRAHWDAPGDGRGPGDGAGPAACSPGSRWWRSPPSRVRHRRWRRGRPGRRAGPGRGVRRPGAGGAGHRRGADRAGGGVGARRRRATGRRRPGPGSPWTTSSTCHQRPHPGQGGGGPVTVELPDGRRFAAEVVGREPRSDLAVLKVPPSAGLRAAAAGQAGRHPGR